MCWGGENEVLSSVENYNEPLIQAPTASRMASKVAGYFGLKEKGRKCYEVSDVAIFGSFGDSI